MLQAEIAFSACKQVDVSSLAEQTASAFGALQLVKDARQLRFQEMNTIERAYPVATTNSESARLQILDWFAKRGVVCGGRLGTWSYINSDVAFVDGRRIAGSIASSI